MNQISFNESKPSMVTETPPTANADVFAHNAGTKNAYVQIMNVNSAGLDTAKGVVRGLADYVMEQVGNRLDIATSRSGNSIKVSGNFSHDPNDYDSLGAVAASLVIGLVKSKAMGQAEGFNALKRLCSQELIGIDQVATGLKEIGFQPEALPNGTIAAPHEARGRTGLNPTATTEARSR